MESELQDKLSRQAAFWQRENHDRPVIGFTGSYFQADVLRVLKVTEGLVTTRDIDVERLLEDYEARFTAWRDCTGDLFWTTSPLQGFFGWLSALAGARVRVSGDTVWTERFLDDFGLLDRLAAAEDSEWPETLWHLTDALVERAAGRYPVSPKAVLSPLATLSEVRGHTELAFDLHDQPDEVQRAMGLLTDAWVRLVLANHERLPEWHGGYTNEVRSIWAPGRIIEFDEDPVFMFSPQMHQKLIMPSHRELVRHFEYPFIHLHSTQLHTLDPLLELDGLAAIELTPDYGDSILDLIPTIARIRDHKPVIVHGYIPADDMRSIIAQVPPEGLCLIGRADTSEEALRLQDAVFG